MSTSVGVALSRVAGGAPFSLTSVSGQLKEPILGKTTNHKFSGDPLDAILKSISDHTGNATLALALPTCVSGEERKALRDVNRVSFSHSVSFIELNSFEITNTDNRPINVLFLDATPGQAAAELSSAELEGDWFVTSEAKTVLTETHSETLSPQDIIEKLVVPTVPKATKLDQIAILRPEGESTELESALTTRFSGARVKWVTLTDLSRGAALWIHRRPLMTPDTKIICSFDIVPVHIGIVLANGQIATVVRRLTIPPSSKTIVLTTSHDNQTTATLQFVNGKKPCGQVVLEEIVPKPKGDVRIQATIEIDHDGKEVATVEELGSTNKKVVELVSFFSCSKEEIEEFVTQENSGANAQIYYDGREVGELPV